MGEPLIAPEASPLRIRALERPAVLGRPGGSNSSCPDRRLLGTVDAAIGTARWRL